MSTFQFLHAADLHLDSAPRGVSVNGDQAWTSAGQATRNALRKLVDLAIGKKVAFLIIAGDVYDGDWDDFNTPLFFNQQMQRLNDANIPVYVVRGNHDAKNKMSQNLRLASNVHYFDTKRPQTFHLDAVGVALHGQSYERWNETADLSQGYPPAEPHVLNIGVLHTCATGRAGHDAYAPCTLEGLRAKRYQYWALGHVHQRETLAEDPFIVFPGNLQGRHIRETGPKGATLVTCRNGAVIGVEAVPLDVSRWVHCRVNVSHAEDVDAALEDVQKRLAASVEQAEGRPVAARVELCGTTPLHVTFAGHWSKWQAEVRAVAQSVADADRLWIEKVELATEPLGPALHAADAADALNTLRQVLREWEASPELVVQEFVDLKKKLNVDKFDADLWGIDHLKRLLQQVEPTLVERLHQDGGDRA